MWKSCGCARPQATLIPACAQKPLSPGLSPVYRRWPLRRIPPILIDKASGLPGLCSGRAAQSSVCGNSGPAIWPACLRARACPNRLRRPLREQCRREQRIAGQPPTIIQPKAASSTGAPLTRRTAAWSLWPTPRQVCANSTGLPTTAMWAAPLPGEPLLWPAAMGDVSVRVVDDAGRAARRNIRVRSRALGAVPPWPFLPSLSREHAFTWCNLPSGAAWLSP